MVAYSFKQRFVQPIRAGLGLMTNSVRPKRQTIRSHGLRRHAAAGDELQLYTGMRTKKCELIGRARCVSVTPVVIYPHGYKMRICLDRREIPETGLDEFSRLDGFANASDMQAFWQAEHAEEKFVGVLIKWEPI